VRGTDQDPSSDTGESRTWTWNALTASAPNGWPTSIGGGADPVQCRVPSCSGAQVRHLRYSRALAWSTGQRKRRCICTRVRCMLCWQAHGFAPL